MTSPAVQQSPYRDESPSPSGSPSHHVAGVSFDAAQLEARRQTLGASEVPAVLGLDRYRTPLDIFLLKRGLVAPFQGNEFTEWGLRIEPAIRQKVAEQLGVTIEIPGTLIHPSEPWASASPDGACLVDGERTTVELKNKGARQRVKWGEPGTDQVPHDIAAQVQWQMLVGGFERAIVGVLFGGSEFATFELRPRPDLTDLIFSQCRDFWLINVVGGVEPAIDGSQRATEYLKAKFAEHSDELLPATREIETQVRTLKKVRESIDALEEQKSAIENQLRATIGAAAGIQGNSFKVTWKTPKPSVVVDYKALVEELHPDSATLARFTSEKQNARRFLVSFPKD